MLVLQLQVELMAYDTYVEEKQTTWHVPNTAAALLAAKQTI